MRVIGVNGFKCHQYIDEVQMDIPRPDLSWTLDVDVHLHFDV